MKKISIKKLVDFTRKSEKSKLTLVKNLNTPNEPSSSGGDYWITCTSALNNAFKENDNQVIIDKIEDLSGRKNASPFKKAKTMFQRNIDILSNFEGCDFSKWLPNAEVKFLPKPRSISIININGLPVQVLPSQVFLYHEGGSPTIGAIWFVVMLDGLRLKELGLYTEALFRYLKANYSNEYKINPELCRAIDLINNVDLSYARMKTKRMPLLLESTIEELKAIA